MILPVITAAIMLGKTIRLDQTPPVLGEMIFDERDVQNHKVCMTNPFTRTQYKLIESSSDVSDFLNVDGELSLLQKASKIEIKGSGHYLSETVDRTKTVELLLSVTTQQKVETLPTYAKQKAGWYNQKHEYLGSHFIRSIVYGGKLIISYKMESEDSKNMEEIKAVVKASLEPSGSVSVALQGKLEKIEKELEGKCKTVITAYASGYPFDKLNNLEQAFELMEKFPTDFKEYTDQNTHLATHLELEPLSTLNSNFEMPISNRTNMEILQEATDKFDDLRNALTQLTPIRDMFSGGDWNDEMVNFENRMKVVRDALKNAIAKINLTAPLDVSSFEEAFKKYSYDGINIPNRYTIELQELKNKASNVVPAWYPYTRAVNEYVHWGSTHCTLPSPDPVLVGVAASSPTGFGSGSDLQCLEAKPSLIEKELHSDMKISAINGLTYQTPETVLSAGKPSPLLCARCKLENATSIMTVPAKRNCPEGTKLEYKGFLATGTISVTDPICIDEVPVEKNDELVVEDDSTANVFKPMWIKCSDCPESSDYGQFVQYVPCVVCSI